MTPIRFLEVAFAQEIAASWPTYSGIEKFRLAIWFRSAWDQEGEG